MLKFYLIGALCCYVETNYLGPFVDILNITNTPTLSRSGTQSAHIYTHAQTQGEEKKHYIDLSFGCVSHKVLDHSVMK